MENFEYLSPSEKIVLLLDGELELANYGSLFYELSQSSELQEELASYITMNNMLSGAVEAPPEKLKTGILAGIGLAGAGAIGTGLSQTGLAHWFTLLFSSKWLIIGITTILASLGGAYVGSNFFANSDSAKNLQIAKEQNYEQSLAPIIIEVPKVASEEDMAVAKNNNSQTNFNSNFKRRTLATNISDDVASDNENSNLLAEEIQSESWSESFVMPEEYELFSDDYSFNLGSFDESNLALGVEQNLSSSGGLDFDPTYRIPKINEYVKPSLLLELRGIASKEFADMQVQPMSEPPINNIGMALYYDLGSNILVGVEMGQENFTQRFTANRNGREFFIEQSTSSFWFGGKVKYHFSEIESLANIQPYIAGFGGLTNVGRLARAEIGGRYMMNSRVAIYLGFETSALFSSYNNVWSSFYKYGATYGIAYKF